jgi:acylphosphatase
MSLERLHLRFHGRVQGVGFRARTCDIAESLGATGWVRNDRDGSVECVAEAEPGPLRSFLERVLHDMSRYLSSHEAAREPATGEFGGFGIRH